MFTNSRGDEFLSCGFSASESCRRQGRDLWDHMHESVLVWVNNTAAPSLVPSPAALANATPSG